MQGRSLNWQLKCQLGCQHYAAALLGCSFSSTRDGRFLPMCTYQHRAQVSATYVGGQIEFLARRLMLPGLVPVLEEMGQQMGALSAS